MPTYLGKEFKWCEKYTLEIPKPDELDDVGQREVTALVYRMWARNLPEEWDWRWVVARGTYCGTLPKRVSSWLYRRHNVKATSEAMSELGNLAARYVCRSNKLTFDFDNRLDWRAGDFGDNGSCYWGCYAGARHMLREHKAFAIRFYDQNLRGYARAWIVNQQSYLLMYNVYGMNGNAVQVQRLLSMFFNTSYSSGPVRFSNRGDESSTLYINGGQGWLVGPSNAIDKIERVDLDWPTISADEDDDDEYTCERCDCSLGDDDVYHLPSGAIVCFNCYTRLVRSCSNCGEEHLRDNMKLSCGGNWYCDDCYDNTFTACANCNVELERDDVDYSDAGDPLCDACAKKREQEETAHETTETA